MSEQIKQGKRPIEQKRQPAFIKDDEVFASVLHVDDGLKKELASKGLECRWVDANRMVRDGGFHPAGWQVYKRDKKAQSDILDFKLGSDPEGIIRRGTCVLATRPISHGDRHRAMLAQRTARQSGVAQEAAHQLREMAKQGNVQSAVDDSFDE